MSISKAERKRRAHAERNRKYRVRQKSREAALKAAHAREWALQMQKQQAAKEAQEKARQEAEAARKAAEPPLPCMFGFGDPRGSCPEKACQNRKNAPLCQYHFDMLYPPSALDLDGPSDISREQVREYQRRKTEAENPFIWKPAPAVNPQDLTRQLLSAPPSADFKYSTYSESSGTVEHQSRAELTAQVRQQREAAAGRTWTQDQIVQLAIDVREQMNRRNDVETE